MTSRAGYVLNSGNDPCRGSRVSFRLGSERDEGMIRRLGVSSINCGNAVLSIEC